LERRTEKVLGTRCKSLDIREFWIRHIARTFPIALPPGICQRAGLMKLPVRLLPLLPALGLAACSGTGDEAPATQAAVESMSPDPVESKRVKTGEWTDHDGDKIEAKFGSMNPHMTSDGKMVASSGKEFSEFNRDNAEFRGRWENKEYKAGEYRKKSWWGDRDYVKKVYGGNTDANSLKKDSRFNGKTAGEGAVAAHDSKKSYRTGEYSTGKAREESKDGIRRVSDAETDERRRVFTSPDIIPWKTQNGMTVDDTKRMLGR
jgi:hypothetical protein